MGRIDDDGSARIVRPIRIDHHQQRDAPPVFTRRDAPLRQDGEAQRAELQQYGNAWRMEINAAVIGAVTGQNARVTGSTATGMERARAAYTQTYQESLAVFRQFHDTQVKPLAKQLAIQNGQPASPFLYYETAVRQLQSRGQVPAGTPTNLLEVNEMARRVSSHTLRQWNAHTSDVRGPDVQKAADFLTNTANHPGNLQQLDPREVVRRTTAGEPAGDYFVRAVPRRYMYDPDAVLTRSERAWVAPLDEVAGLRLNRDAVQERLGFHDPSDYSLIVLRSQDFTDVTVPTWDVISNMSRAHSADPNSPLHLFSNKPASFWEGDIRAINLDQHISQMSTSNMSPQQYTLHLNQRTPGLGDAFLARYEINRVLGANPQFSGAGYTLDTQGQVGTREYLLGQRGQMSIANFSEHAFLDLDTSTPGTMETVSTSQRVPNMPGLTAQRVGTGTASAFGVSTVLSGGQAINEIMNGRDAGEAFLAAGQQVGINTVAGAGGTVIEHYSTNAISRVAGTGSTFAGQVGRQAFGSGVAGGVVNTGLALYGNYEAFEKGEITGAEYTGRVAGEAAVGVAAGVAGAYAGAAIGSFIPIPVVGTLAGAAVGFAVGYAADALMRHFEVDKAIGSATTAVVNFGGEIANNVTETVSNVIEDAGQTLNNLASGAANKLASIFG